MRAFILRILSMHKAHINLHEARVNMYEALINMHEAQVNALGSVCIWHLVAL